MRVNRIAFIPAAILIAASALPVRAQQTVVYPSKGQSAQQQSADEGACYAWTKQKAGIDPAVVTNAAPQAQAQNAQMESAQRQALASYHQAWDACMQGRGYLVR